MKKILLISVLAFGLLFTSNAQQDAMFTHYMFNTIAINPAYAGSRDALTVTGLHRSQWVSFDGAPTTQTINMHSPLLFKNTGIGLSFINDAIGPTNTTGFFLDFSYKIKVSQKAHLAFGIKAGMNMMSNELNQLATGDALDPAFANNIQSKLLPNFGFGLYYFTDKYYFGASSPKLLENDFAENSTSGNTNPASEEKHYFFIAGTMLTLNQDLKFKPTTFVKVTAAAPMEVDLTGTLYFRDRIWLGAMFRTGDAAGLLAGMNITDQFAFGYSYDWSFTNTSFRYNGGSHEVMLRYDFIFGEKQKIRSPRYF
jgi:type IX secretion system PorP/SprF family membrane protein